MSVVVFVCVCVCMCVFACLKQKDMVQCLSVLLSSSASTFPSRWLLKVIADVSIGLILMGRPSLSSFTQFCILVCIYLHKWGTYASYLYPVIFDLCGVFDYLLIPFYQSVCFLLFPSAHLLVVAAARQHFSHYLFQAVLYIWAQTSDPGVLRYKISHPAIESLNCVTSITW